MSTLNRPIRPGKGLSHLGSARGYDGGEEPLGNYLLEGHWQRASGAQVNGSIDGRGRHRRWEPGGGRTGLHGESFFPGHGGEEMGVKFSGEEGMTHLLEPNPRGEREDFYAISRTEGGKRGSWREPPYCSMRGGVGDASSAWVKGDHGVRKPLIPLLEEELPKRGNFIPSYGGEGPGPPGVTFHHGSWEEESQTEGTITGPLIDQWKKDCCQWGEAAVEATRTRKTTMTSATVLTLPDFTQQLVVETDASGIGPSAELKQEHKPFVFFSKVRSPRARLESVYEREHMAIGLAIQKRQPYLLGHQFIVQTGQRSIKYLLEQRGIAEEHQKWQGKLLGYDCEIQYKPEIRNKAAGVLLRVEYSQFLILSVPQLAEWADLFRENQPREEMERIRTDNKNMEEGFKGYHLENSFLIYQGRIYQSPKSFGRSMKEARNSSGFNLEDKVELKGAVMLRLLWAGPAGPLKSSHRRINSGTNVPLYKARGSAPCVKYQSREKSRDQIANGNLLPFGSYQNCHFWVGIRNSKLY